MVAEANEARSAGILGTIKNAPKFLQLGIKEWRWIQTAANLSLPRLREEQGIYREFPENLPLRGLGAARLHR